MRFHPFIKPNLYICGMKYFRFLLFPFGIIYFIITSVRNFLYDKGFLKSYTAPIPVIAVGNLSVGGTGKTPQIEYLIRLLSDQYQVATLSRGYKRKTEGFVLANTTTTVTDIGDEPFQYFSKFKNILVAVDADRTRGIKKLLHQNPAPQVILLDDAYQHRKVKAHFYILLTAYSDLYYNDFILPVGNLRESTSEANRAPVIIVTKCPKGLTSEEQNRIIRKINPKNHQKVFFSTIGYDEKIYSKDASLEVNDVRNRKKVLLAGIAKPEPFFDHLKNQQDIILRYPDHHNFSEAELEQLRTKYQNELIITTEKDFVRLDSLAQTNQLFYLPIKTEFLHSEEEFNRIILGSI